MHNYEIKEKVVREGKSKIFQNWNKFTGISVDDFLEGLKWVCEDPEKDYGDGKIRMTRELGCRADGKLVKLRRVNTFSGEFIGFYEIETNMLWANGISINCCDRI